MAVLLYSNGIIEEYRPRNFFFTEKELVDIFKEHTEIKTERMIDILNTWCIYGKNTIEDPIEFNKIASEVINNAVYSPLLFIHDSEMNPKWKTTETLLYKGYDEFVIEVKKYIDDIANDIIEQIQSVQEYDDNVKVLPQLETIGATPDKRILFGFNIHEQEPDFYQNDEFYIFSRKVYDYISKNKQEKEPFTIYADKKAVIIIEPTQVVTFLNTMLEKFKSKEEYEICTVITNIINKWTNKKNKKPRTKKASGNNKL